MAPTAKQMGLPFNAGPTWDDRQDRFVNLVANKAFLCPENDVLAGNYGTMGVAVHQMISYNTSLLFQTRYNQTWAAQGLQGSDGFSSQSYVDTGAYRPRLDMVGNGAAKAFMADGARWSDGTLLPTDNLAYLKTGGDSPSNGGAFADYGPWDGYTRAYNRSNAPANNAHPLANAVDYRSYAFRHGPSVRFSAANQFKFNVAFFDGHVDTMGDLDGADPAMWAPKGSVVPITEAAGFKDVQNRYFAGQSQLVIP